MGYESAPATKLLATHCACCGRPLLDADSVEAGMGPVCRKGHGWAKADVAVDFLAVAAALAAKLPADVYVATVKGCADARQAANRLVHRAACAWKGEDGGCEFIALTSAIAELGYTTLADRLVKRAKGVRVVRIDAPMMKGGEHLGVFLAGYVEGFPKAARAIGGRPTKLSARVWRWDFPLAARQSLWGVLKATLPAGTPVMGEKGVKVL